FFFSSRRRHTRLVSDWSSDVCSSDLWLWPRRFAHGSIGLDIFHSVVIHDAEMTCAKRLGHSHRHLCLRFDYLGPHFLRFSAHFRSEERRVGKEVRCMWVTLCFKEIVM